MRWLPILIVVAGCGGYGYIGRSAAPRLPGEQGPVEVAVAGDDKAAVDEAVDWVLRGNPGWKRVSSGGDRRIALKGTFTQARWVLGGSDLTFAAEVTTGSGSTTRAFKREGLVSNVPVERERLITEAVVWALAQVDAAAIDEPLISDTPMPSPNRPSAKPAKNRPRRR